jgi:hypothetical protein
MAAQDGMPMDEGAGAVFADGGDVEQPVEQAAAPQPAAPPQPVHVLSPEGELGTIDPSEVDSATQNGYTLATPEDLAQNQYGGLGQQTIAGLEGAAQGATFGLSTGLETAIGVNPEDIRGRAQANPITHNVGQVAGLIGSSVIPGVGEANLLKGAGEAAAEAVGVGGAGAGFLSQVGADTVKGAFEAALFQGGEEISKMYSQDPNQTAESAIADIGLAGVMGGVFGGSAGALLRKAGFGAALDAPGGAVGTAESTAPSFVSELDRPKVEAGDFEASIKNSNVIPEAQKKSILDGLRERKPDAAEITAAAERINAPVLEGMTSGSRVVQKAEDSLLNGAPTYSGLKRQSMYNEGWKAANAAVEGALGEGSQLSKAEIGNYFKDSITKDIKTQNAPISQMYEEIKRYHRVIPVPEGSGDSLAAELERIPELRVSPSSPGSQLVKNVINEVGNLRTVDDIKAYRSSLYDRLPATASPGERRMAAIISDKLKTMEEDGVETFAKNIPANDEVKATIQSLIGQRKAADAQYKPFIQKIQTLSEQLGKGKIHGAQDAIHFINDLTPESVTQKLFAKNNSEFLNFFSKNFPEQMEAMRAYQKNALREAASKSGELSPRVLFNNVNKLEPEIQKSIFKPEELQKLRDAETVVRSFPKDFNPSGTSGMSAFRQFFEHPAGAAIGNVRDLAIEKFIKTFAGSPEVKNATKLAQSTVSGYRTMTKAVKSIMDPSKGVMAASIVPSVAARDRLAKLVDDYAKNPQKMLEANANNPFPAYSQAFSTVSSRAVQYLVSQRPNTAPANPLDSRLPASPIQKAQYNRALDIAQQPLTVLKHINDGSLTPQDCTTLRTIYPNLYNQLCGKLSEGIVSATSKGIKIPYQRRLSMSMMMGQALDSTMTPQGIISAQPLPPQQQPQGGAPGNKPKKSTSTLNKLPGQYKTAGQAAEEDRANKD